MTLDDINETQHKMGDDCSFAEPWTKKYNN